MDGKKNVCGTCRWFLPFTAVCTNDRSDKCADFVDGMEDRCPHHESYPGLRFETDGAKDLSAKHECPQSVKRNIPK